MFWLHILCRLTLNCKLRIKYLYVEGSCILTIKCTKVTLTIFLVCNHSLGMWRTMSATHAGWIQQWN